MISPIYFSILMYIFEGCKVKIAVVYCSSWKATLLEQKRDVEHLIVYRGFLWQSCWMANNEIFLHESEISFPRGKTMYYSYHLTWLLCKPTVSLIHVSTLHISILSEWSLTPLEVFYWTVREQGRKSGSGTT